MSYAAARIQWEDRDTLKSARAFAARALKSRAAAPVESGMSDREICHMAERRADLMTDRIFERTAATTPEAIRQWLSDQLEGLGARKLRTFAPGEDEAAALAGLLERARCRLWWRRQLRRAVVQLRELEAMERGEVCKARRQVYCTDDTVLRKARRNAANDALMAETKIESIDGEVITLAQAIAASTSNKALRRHELMTRIRGCEEWAQLAGMVGLFTTNTCPSRFHPQTMHGGANPKHHHETARDGQQWLCSTWAKARAALQRLGLPVFGFRVAEPHHDGCPHWHMLLWCATEHLDAVKYVLRAVWLGAKRWQHFGASKSASKAAPLFSDLITGEPNAGRWEPGAALHRFKAVDIDPALGSAVGYVSKYISKNIDGVGAMEAEAHKDEQAGAQAELFGATAARVEAWAAAHGIRQFQAIGQPPVTVWRELRRVEPQAVQGATPRVQQAHTAAHRGAGRRADWAAYMVAQGGAMVGRAYRVRIVADMEQINGRYGPAVVQRVRGVCDVARADVVVLSARRQWKAAGTWTQAEREPNPLRQIRLTDPAEALRAALGFGEAPKATCPPRTRFINCTQIAGRTIARREPLKAWTEEIQGAGAQNMKENDHEQDRNHHGSPPHLCRSGSRLGRFERASLAGLRAA